MRSWTGACVRAGVLACVCGRAGVTMGASVRVGGRGDVCVRACIWVALRGLRALPPPLWMSRVLLAP